MKTAAGQFLNILLVNEDSNFYLTVTDRIYRNQKLCENFALPNQFVMDVAPDGTLEEVKLAI